MLPRLLPAILIFIAMAAAPVLAELLRPTASLADQRPKVDLETMVPKQFGRWHALPASVAIIADPQTQEKLARIYTEVLSRTYVDSQGRQIMLSIAYGANQRDNMGMHYPEVCYPAQGFQSHANSKAQLTSRFGTIKVKRLEMALGPRYEPVTYWTMMGDHQSLGGIEKKLIEIRYALDGTIPDGLLFRVSSIGRDSVGAYRDQESFVAELLDEVSPEVRKRLAGL